MLHTELSGSYCRVVPGEETTIHRECVCGAECHSVKDAMKGFVFVAQERVVKRLLVSAQGHFSKTPTTVSQINVGML